MNTSEKANTNKPKFLLTNFVAKTLGTVLATVLGIYITNLLMSKAPIPEIIIDPISGKVPLSVVFDGTGSHDPDGDTLKFFWILELGSEADTISTKSSFRDTLTEPGQYRVQLVVVDDKKQQRSKGTVIHVQPDEEPNLTPTARIEVNPSNGVSPLKVNLNGETSHDPDGEALSYYWILENDTISFEPEFEQLLNEPGSYRIELAVTDSEGGTGRDSKIINVRGPEPRPIATKVKDNHLYSITLNASKDTNRIQGMMSKLQDVGFNMEDAVFLTVAENAIIYYDKSEEIENKVQYIRDFFRRRFGLKLKKEYFGNVDQRMFFTITIK